MTQNLASSMKNQLAGENSPYLLQHADNPVAWCPWGAEALEKARQEDKPIFLSIGYAACHWCHVMAHESFENGETAALMNENFVNIKVDREERPDLDGIYMQAVIAMTGQGGWPLSVFLTPDGQPFYGGTYFPPIRRYNMPSFREVLLAITRLWRDDRPRLLESSRQISEHLQASPITMDKSTPLTLETLEEAAKNLAQSYDWKFGGWGKAPKFPQPMALEFLLRKATRGDSVAREMAAHALHAMARGGMYDVVGGGFARYSTDNRWLVPHFEKMLYDNAQLALAYLHGWLVCDEPDFRRVCEETLDFLVREMMHPIGGFYSSLDADSEGEEGKFYLWNLQEIREVVKDTHQVVFLEAAYGLTENGNFEGRNILQRTLTDEELAQRFGILTKTVPIRLQNLHQRLLAARSQRIPPATDDKVLVAWNALALAAFAEAGRYLKRADYLEVAQRNARFLLENLTREGRLMRSWRNNQAQHSAYLEDYAALALGLLALYQSDANPLWYTQAKRLLNEIITHFSDPNGGFYDTRDDAEVLIIRPKDIQDNATPSGNALAACTLLQMAAFEGQSDWFELAFQMIGALHPAMQRYPTAFCQWLQAADFALGPIQEVAIVGDQQHPDMAELRDSLWSSYRPRLVAAIAEEYLPNNSPALLVDRPMLNGLPTAFVCQNYICKQPTNSAQNLRSQLES